MPTLSPTLLKPEKIKTIKQTKKKAESVLKQKTLAVSKRKMPYLDG